MLLTELVLILLLLPALLLVCEHLAETLTLLLRWSEQVRF